LKNHFKFSSVALIAVALIGTVGLGATISHAGEEAATNQDALDLAKKTQNPISDLISVPLQNNFNFSGGPDDEMQYVLNIQPVYPLRIHENWNWINRVILPVIYQPFQREEEGGKAGLGDIQYQGFLVPAKASKFVWGVGPVVQFPSATDEILGTEKWSMGPGAVALVTQGRWVIGSLINNIWSIGGRHHHRQDVNLMTWQYFVNYNLPKGWYLTSSPIMTVNWQAANDDKWTVPIGGGFGKIFKIGKLPLNFQVAAFYNLEHPENTSDWSLRLQLQFLFPKD